MASTRKQVLGKLLSTSPIILSYPFYTKLSLAKDTPNTILQYFLMKAILPEVYIIQKFETLNLDE